MKPISKTVKVRWDIPSTTGSAWCHLVSWELAPRSWCSQSRRLQHWVHLGAHTQSLGAPRCTHTKSQRHREFCTISYVFTRFPHSAFSIKQSQQSKVSCM